MLLEKTDLHQNIGQLDLTETPETLESKKNTSKEALSNKKHNNQFQKHTAIK